MNTVERSALVPYTAQQMFELVNDIDRYPEFLSWCSTAEVLDQQGDVLVASLGVAYKGFQQSFTTENVNKPHSEIKMSLQGGNSAFRSLNGRWVFEDLSDAEPGCKVSLEMSFSFNNFFLRQMFGPVFTQIANTQIDAFIQQAKRVYSNESEELHE